MSSKLPFIQLYPKDYIADTRPLSLAARGAWFDIMCYLWMSQNRGQMQLPVIGWARLISATVEQTVAVIAEMEVVGVCDVERHSNGDVTLACRRMVREELEREQTRLRVQKHRDSKKAEPTPENPIEAPEPKKKRISNAACNGGSNADVTPYITDCILHINTPQPPEGAERVPVKGVDYGKLPGFCRFWEAYPARGGVRQGKAEAAKVWQRAKLEQQADRIVTHVAAMAKTEDWRKEQGRFVPQARTYLNQRRWEDEIETAAARTHINPQPTAGTPDERWLDVLKTVLRDDDSWIESDYDYERCLADGWHKLPLSLRQEILSTAKRNGIHLRL